MEPDPESPQSETERIDPVEARAALDEELYRIDQLIQSYKDKTLEAALAGVDARRRLKNAKEAISRAMKLENANELRKAELLADYANAEVDQLRSEQTVVDAGGALSYQRSEASRLRIIRDRVLAEEPITSGQQIVLGSLIKQYRATKVKVAAAAVSAEMDF